MLNILFNMDSLIQFKDQGSLINKNSGLIKIESNILTGPFEIMSPQLTNSFRPI